MKLGNWLADNIITEQANITKTVVIYPGRFQPIGKHHAQVYKQLVRKFGEVWVATSNKVDLPKSPFNFNEKKKIINSHGIKKVAQVKNPYKAEEILKKYDPKTTAVIFAVGKKDQQRLGGNFFRPWKGKAEVGYRDGAYTIIAPHVKLNVPGQGEMSGTAIRKALGDKDTDRVDKKKIFKGIFGHTKNYNLIINKLEKLNEVMEGFCHIIDIKELIMEISKTGKTSGGLPTDDGPRYWRTSYTGYKKRSEEGAERLGWEVVDYIVGDIKKFETYGTKYPNGPVGPVSYAPTGIAQPEVRDDYKGEQRIGAAAYNKWKKHITKVAKAVGWEFVNFLGAEDVKQDSKGERLRKKEEPTPAMIKKLTKITKKSQKDMEKGKDVDLIPAIDDKGKDIKENINTWLAGEAKKLITEGGAYGHMAHPFDDKDLKFSDFKKMIELSLQGNLSIEQTATEKTDGQNLFITWDRSLKAARNAGDIKRGGMSGRDIAAKFKGRGPLYKAFVGAFKDLDKAIGKLSDKQQKKIFDNGNNWMNMEIMYPESVNVIVYDAPYLQFHGALKYKDGRPVGTVRDSGRMLAGMIKQVNQQLQKTFKIIGPNPLKTIKSQDFGKRRKYFVSKLNKLMKEFNLKDSDEFAVYHQSWWEDFINKKAPSKVNNNVLVGLTKRWAFFDKSFRINSKFIDDEKTLEWAKKIDKENHAAQVKKNMLPFELLFFELGAEILKNTEGFLAANPDKAIQAMRKKVATAVKAVKGSGDLKKINKVKDNLDKIKAIGGWKAVVPTEGLVFIYGGKTYKLTGTFAPINQITGALLSL